ncbi:MAG TPA: F0F1 ATP synthase subunit A [Candidatus Angelobacter sp.]|nr:F0F1 ATP synthase subunit A [Candidatus Angelobacter sp.]
MPEQLWFTQLLNHYFGAMTTSLLRSLGIQPAHPAAPINNIVSMEVLAVLVLIVLFFVVRSRLSVEKPGTLQQTVEMAEEFIGGQAREIIGHDFQRHVPYVLALAMFILLCNLLGLIPGLESPTTNPAVPLGCAVTTFIYYHFYGIRHHGAHYIKQFLGPVWWMAPLFFLIEIISHLARILSLTVRLYANMFAGDMVTMAFFSLVPILVPVAFLGLHLFVALVQTFIFAILTTVYVGMAVSEEH